MAEENQASEIPDKLYFKIGEVSKILDVKPYVLRYWESEFKTIRPQKSKSNQRLYRKRDVELLVEIKRLLYDERFTIAGARTKLKEIHGIKGKDGLDVADGQLMLPAALDVRVGSRKSKRLPGKEYGQILDDVRKGLAELVSYVS